MTALVDGMAQSEEEDDVVVQSQAGEVISAPRDGGVTWLRLLRMLAGAAMMATGADMWLTGGGLGAALAFAVVGWLVVLTCSGEVRCARSVHALLTLGAGVVMGAFIVTAYTGTSFVARLF